MSQTMPGWEGSVGPFPSQYGKPHVYARDVHSGAGNCVCGRDPRHRLHPQLAPGVPNPDFMRPVRGVLHVPEPDARGSGRCVCGQERLDVWHLRNGAPA